MLKVKDPQNENYKILETQITMYKTHMKIIIELY